MAEETHVAPEIALAPPITTGAQKLTEEERLRMENFFLRMQNIQLQVRELDAQKSNCFASLQDITAELETFRKQLTDKYGVEITRTTVKADGTLVQPTASSAGLATELMRGAPKPQ